MECGRRSEKQQRHFTAEAQKAEGYSVFWLRGDGLRQKPAALRGKNTERKTHGAQRTTREWGGNWKTKILLILLSCLKPSFVLFVSFVASLANPLKDLYIVGTPSWAEVPFVRLLVVEDEKKVARFIKQGLEEEGYAVDVAHDGEEGLTMGLDGVHDLIILDISLPRMDGIQVLGRLREKKVATPVLLLTARAAVEDKVLGLDAGADDYLTKPFAFEELVARVRALLRRRGEGGASLLRYADLTLDPARRTVFRGETKIELTAKEFALLEYFLRNPERVLTRTMILDHVWGYDFDPETNVIDVYVNYLRKKIDSDRDLKLIHTVRGAGYVLKSG